MDLTRHSERKRKTPLGIIYDLHDDASGMRLNSKTLTASSAVVVKAIRNNFSALVPFEGQSLVQILSTQHNDCQLQFIYEHFPYSLETCMAQGPLAVELAQRWTLQLLKGLLDMHSCGQAHGNLKPRNIFLREYSPDAQVYIGDAGLLPLLKDLKPRPSRYAAPEQLNGEFYSTTKSDIYSLGVIVYEMFSHRKFKRNTESSYEALSFEGVDFVWKCLQPFPKNRPTAFELSQHPFLRSCKTDIMDTHLLPPDIIAHTVRIDQEELKESMVVAQISSPSRENEVLDQLNIYLQLFDTIDRLEEPLFCYGMVRVKEGALCKLLEEASKIPRICEVAGRLQKRCDYTWRVGSTRWNSKDGLDTLWEKIKAEVDSQRSSVAVRRILLEVFIEVFPENSNQHQAQKLLSHL